MTGEDDRAALRRIAAILGVPVSAFFQPAGDPGPMAGSERIGRAAAAILAVLASIPDPHEGARCLARVRRALADQGPPGDGHGDG